MVDFQFTDRTINYYFDKDRVLVEVDSFTRTQVILSVKLIKPNEHFKDRHARFILQRMGRNDLNFSSQTHANAIENLVLNDENEVIGISKLKANIDATVKEIKIVLQDEYIETVAITDPEPEQLTPDPEPEQPTPDPEPEQPEMITLNINSDELSELIANGKVEVTVNNQKLTARYDDDGWGASDIDLFTVEKYGNIHIVIRNLQTNNVFDLENMSFDLEEYNPYSSQWERNPIPVTTKTSDLIEINVTGEQWVYAVSRLTHNPPTFKALPQLKFIVREVTPTEDYPFLKIYSVDDENLKSLTKEIIAYNRKGGIDSTMQNYIPNLIRLPYDITSDELTHIQLADVGMTSQGYLITNYLFKTTIGKIMCSHDSLQGIGYKNIEFNLIIPYFKPIKLDVPKFIDREITLNMIIDLTTGVGTLNILVDNIVTMVEVNKVGVDIPFKADSVNLSLQNDVINTDFSYPFLEIIVLDPDNSISSNIIKQRGVEQTNLKYIKSEKALLNTTATVTEQLELESLLRKGVFLNGTN